MRHRLHLHAVAVVLVAGSMSPALAQPASTNPARPRLGMNLSGPADWNTELPFADVFRLSRRWISHKEGQPWGKGPALLLDKQGWVRELAPGCWAETPLCTIEGGHYPSGRYTVLYQGEGQLEATGAARVVESKPGRIILDVDSRRGGFFLQIKTTNPANYVRQIQVLMPGIDKVDPEAPWSPTFLERWRGVACLRFMDLMQTNGSEIKTWDDRPRLDDASWTARGVPLEVLIDLANRLNIDPWFCIPHQANDDYVKAFAKLLKARLNPGLKAYVEYSNEVWNGGFAQHHYAANQGQALGLAEKTWEAAWRFTAVRSVEIFKIVEQELPRDRMVRVLASQAANAFVSQQVLGYRDAFKHADVLAIAPYLSFNVDPRGKPSAAEVATWSVKQVLDHVERVSLPEATRWIQAQKAIADKHGLALVAYEGGQHFVGVAGGEQIDALTKVLTAANRDPRLASLYSTYLDRWTAAGGGLFCHFSSISAWSKWGSWGLLEYADEDPERSPKLRATLDWARRQGQALPVRNEKP